jgi:ATP-dependent DNA helicase RecG
VEFKSSMKDVDTLGRIVCGFLNTTGGYLICGIQEPGKVVGVGASADAIATLEKRLHDGLSPKALVSVQVQPLEGKSVVVIEVPSGKDVPYAFRDSIFLRTGDSTLKADAESIRDIVMRRQVEPERWERRFAFADVENDVDYDEVQSAVTDANKVRRAFFRKGATPLMVLEDFAAAKYGRLTNGGDVLFAKNPAVRLPQTRIRAMRYNSNKAGETYRDLKSFEGPLHRIFEQAYSFIVRNTPSTARFIKGNPKREDAPIYPEEAVREALINSLAHRDYSAASGGVSIHIFPGRLEIWNSGGLPDGVTTASLTKGHISVLRNPDISHVLYLRGLMEKAGRGSVLMIQQCRENGLRDPEWSANEKVGVTVTFYAPEVTREVAREVTPEATREVTPEATQEVRRLLQSLKGNMLRRELQVAMGLKDEEHFRKAYLLPALGAGLVEMTVPEKRRSSKQRYRLTALGRSALARRS